MSGPGARHETRKLQTWICELSCSPTKQRRYKHIQLGTCSANYENKRKRQREIEYLAMRFKLQYCPIAICRIGHSAKLILARILKVWQITDQKVDASNCRSESRLLGCAHRSFYPQVYGISFRLEMQINRHVHLAINGRLRSQPPDPRVFDQSIRRPVANDSAHDAVHWQSFHAA